MGDAQGNPYLANLGDRAGAMRSYQKAFEMHAAIAAPSPTDAAAQRDVAADHMRIADMLWADARTPTPCPATRESLAVSNALATRKTPLRRRGSLQRGEIVEPHGTAADERRRPSRRAELYQQSALADLSAAAPDNVAYRRRLRRRRS